MFFKYSNFLILLWIFFTICNSVLAAPSKPVEPPPKVLVLHHSDLFLFKFYFIQTYCTWILCHFFCISQYWYFTFFAISIFNLKLFFQAEPTNNRYKVENISKPAPQKAFYHPSDLSQPQTPFQPPDQDLPPENNEFPVQYQQPTQRPVTTQKAKKTSIVPPPQPQAPPSAVEEKMHGLKLNDFSTKVKISPKFYQHLFLSNILRM